MEIPLFKNNLILPPERLSHKEAPYWILPSSLPTTTMASQISSIWEALKADPLFQALSKAGQANYLILADLERPLVEALAKVDWSDSSHHLLHRKE
ncbi:MAG: hypothetical protein ACJAVK_002522 [Akkermansiaceae bacterium]|jgi:hypothetical protein